MTCVLVQVKNRASCRTFALTTALRKACPKLDAKILPQETYLDVGSPTGPKSKSRPLVLCMVMSLRSQELPIFRPAHGTHPPGIALSGMDVYEFLTGEQKQALKGLLSIPSEVSLCTPQLKRLRVRMKTRARMYDSMARIETHQQRFRRDLAPGFGDRLRND